MNLDCLSGIITSRLAVHIDVSDIKSWNLNTGFTSISLTKWANAKSDNLNLLDFGLTAYDNGRVNKMHNGLLITPSDTKLILYRVGYNNATGGTFYNGYEISGVTSANTVGNYFELNGGYLQGFFKLQGQDFELLPNRFGEGITIENILRIDPTSSGIFFLMGARAEDKYNTYFSGETELIVEEESKPVSSGVVGQTNYVTTTITEFSGVTTSKGHYLNAFIDEEVKKKAFSSFEYSTDIVPVEQPKTSTFENVIAFEITEDKKIAIKRINSLGLVDDKVSDNSITSTGWTIITHVFTPDQTITDPELLKCADRRKGTLTFYVNGRRFWSVENYDEYYFTSIKNDDEKTLGVPYNISWGGGSFGLKHSWHYDINEVSLYSGNNNTYVNQNFVVTDYPLNTDLCPPTATTGNITLSADSTSFAYADECDNTILHPITVLLLMYSGTTAQTSTNQYYFEYNEPIELISNRDYVFSVDLYDLGIFQNHINAKSKISLVIYGTEDVEVLEEIPYIVDGLSLPLEWRTIEMKLKTKDNSGLNTFKVGILIESNMNLNNNTRLFMNNFKYIGSDKLAQDSTKSNLPIEQNFDSSFVGGIQKLRIYDVAFNSQEVLHNARIESINNPGYELIIKRGGRIIYR